MKTKIIVTIFVSLFVFSSAFACQDFFCETIKGNGKINLQIHQGYNDWSQDSDTTASQTNTSFQGIFAKGYASEGASSYFEAEAVQGQFYDKEYSLGANEVQMTGYSFMESLAQGKADAKCKLDFVSFGNHFSRSSVNALPSGISTALDMKTEGSVYGSGKNLSFDGVYEQVNSIYTESQNGFTLSNGFTGVKINK